MQKDVQFNAMVKEMEQRVKDKYFDAWNQAYGW